MSSENGPSASPHGPRPDRTAGPVERVVDHLYERTAYDRLVKTRPYLKMLDQIQQYLVPRTYVEVGVSKGTSLTLALPGTTCVGVDPEPDIQFPLLSSAKIYRLTSDAFFEEVDLPAQLGQFSVDLAFIDGLHLFEFALRDFMNLERYSSRDTTILIHDCLPTDEASASRDRAVRRWTGDVWKVIVCLRQWRPDLDVSVADIGPCGLGIVRGLDPTSTRLRDNYDDICAQFIELPFRSFEESDRTELMGLIPGDWDHVRPLLPGRPFRDEDVMTLKTRRLLHALPRTIRPWVSARRRQLSRRRGRAGA